MSIIIMAHLMNKKNNCRKDRSESWPPDIPGRKSPENAWSSLMNKIITVDRTVPKAVLVTCQAGDVQIEYQVSDEEKY